MNAQLLYAVDRARYDGWLFDCLCERGVRVTSVDSASEAIRQVQQKRFSTVLSDILLPPGTVADSSLLKIMAEGSLEKYGLIGLEFIRKTRESINRDTPIIVATSIDGSDDIQFPEARKRAAEAGANGFYQFDCRDDDYDRIISAVMNCITAVRTFRRS